MMNEPGATGSRRMPLEVVNSDFMRGLENSMIVEDKGVES
jgi:hypothetical protein